MWRGILRDFRGDFKGDKWNRAMGGDWVRDVLKLKLTFNEFPCLSSWTGAGLTILFYFKG